MVGADTLADGGHHLRHQPLRRPLLDVQHLAVGPAGGPRPEDYRRGLPATLRNVNLTGGEALLRPDIVEIAQAIHEAAGPPSDHPCHERLSHRTHAANGGADPAACAEPRSRGIDRRGRRNARSHAGCASCLRARRHGRCAGLRDQGISDIRIGFTATPGERRPVDVGLPAGRGTGRAVRSHRRAELRCLLRHGREPADRRRRRWRSISASSSRPG